MTQTIRVGARRSPLAVAQAEWVAAQLRTAGHPSELVGIESLGDRDRRQLTQIGGTGVFATAVRDALHDRSIDVAVHSLKDLPVAPAPGLVVSAIPVREDVRDVLVGLDVDQWVDGTRVGTGSPRRAAQVRAMAQARGVTVEVVPVRGNVDTRLDLVRNGDVDATLLAAAGLLRLGRLDASLVDPSLDEQQLEVGGLPVRLLSLQRMLPAAGQGALAVETREDIDPDLAAALASIDHAATRAAVDTERTFLATLEAGCLAPVGCHARVDGDDLTLFAVAEAESSVVGLVTGQLGGAPGQARETGQRLAQDFLRRLA